MIRELNIWMNGEFVGVWSRPRSGAHRLTYAQSWLQSEKRRSLSLSLPIAPSREIRGDAVLNYFDNLLPESDAIRRRLSRRFRTTTAAFELLTAIGRDCVGAVQLLPPGTTPEGVHRIEAMPLDDADIERLLSGVTAEPMPGVSEEDLDAFRISIAGTQEKTALLRKGNSWFRPLGATPTTHILKLPLGIVGGRQVDMSDSVENEWLCGQILREIGLPVAHTEIGLFGAQKVLVVERFDRQWVEDTWIARLPQEDFCQALGVPPSRKYRSDGGPGIEEGLQLLSGSAASIHDRERFLLTQLAFWLLAAPDGHAKNFSIFLNTGDSYRLTPLYDLLSAWPVIGHGANLLPLQKATLAMGVRGKNMHYRLTEVHASHFQGLASRSGVPGVWDRMLELVSRVPTAIRAVESRLPQAFPGRVFEAISRGMLSQAQSFDQQLARGSV